MKRGKEKTHKVFCLMNSFPQPTRVSEEVFSAFWIPPLWSRNQYPLNIICLCILAQNCGHPELIKDGWWNLKQANLTPSSMTYVSSNPSLFPVLKWVYQTRSGKGKVFFHMSALTGSWPIWKMAATSARKNAVIDLPCLSLVWEWGAYHTPSICHSESSCSWLFFREGIRLNPLSP